MRGVKLKFRKPLQDKIILVDIILGFAVIGNIGGVIYVPTWWIILLVALAILLELSSRLIRQTQIANIWKLVKDIAEKDSDE